MEQVKVGKFIAECRKNKNMTQAELAEKLNITDRAISKWETGKGMPDSSIMLELCNELDITVNELLSGEVIKMETYNQKAEENLLEMKKKIGIGIGIFLILLIILGIITNYADGGRVSTGHEPKYCIKVVSSDGSKVIYWGLGYKVIRYVGVSPNEPYENNIGAKMGSWFMDYKLPKSNTIEIEYEGQTITITDMKDIGTIENILLNSKYDGEICDGINTHKIVLNNEVYYIKESCKEIQKGNKQATISTEDLSTIKSIIDNKINDEQNNTKSNRSSENVTIEINNSTIKPESVSITITDNNENQYGWGVEFRVQEKGDGEWKNLNYISDELSWIDIAYELNEDKQLTQKLDIEKYYGKLPNGIYRIVKPVYDNGYIDIYSNEFEIK